MYSGNLIEELFATVERAEEHVRDQNPDQELERWFATAHASTPRVQTDLLGVA